MPRKRFRYAELAVLSRQGSRVRARRPRHKPKKSIGLWHNQVETIWFVRHAYVIRIYQDRRPRNRKCRRSRQLLFAARLDGSSGRRYANYPRFFCIIVDVPL
jgi:hypothetical protein